MVNKNKKGVSDIVITVSMILVAIVSVGVISAFLVPMIQSQLGKSTSCIALKENFKVRTDIPATCYDSQVNNVAKLSIQRGSEKEEANGFSVTIFTSEGDAEAYRIYNETADFSTTPGIPSRGGAKTYSFPITSGSKIVRVTIATILDTDETCDAMEYTNLRIC